MDIKNLIKQHKEGQLNHEIRFSCNRETKKQTDEIFRNYFQDSIKKAHFNRLIFQVGLEETRKLIIQKTGGSQK